MVLALWEGHWCLSVSETEVLPIAAVGVVMPPEPKGGAMLRGRRRPSEARNESGLTRNWLSME